jgi:hypothetical protein
MGHSVVVQRGSRDSRVWDLCEGAPTLFKGCAVERCSELLVDHLLKNERARHPHSAVPSRLFFSPCLANTPTKPVVAVVGVHSSWTVVVQHAFSSTHVGRKELLSTWVSARLSCVVVVWKR